MRIVHVEDSFDPAAGYQINELLKIQHNNVEQMVITSKDVSAFHKVLDFNEDRFFENTYNVKIIRLEIVFKLSSRMILKQLWKTINSQKPDILFLHGIGDFKDISLFFSKKKYIVVRDCHMSWVASINRYAKYFFKIYSMIFSPIINSTNKYHKIFALGDEELEYLLNLGIKEDKIEMLPHGYNKEDFYFDSVERIHIRTELKINENNILICYTGKFDEYKRPDLIFDILELLPEKNSFVGNIRLLFIGPKDPNYMQTIFNPKMEQSKFKEITQILPSKPFIELKGYYSASDICLWPKQTTLSSIHAQVCRTKTIMEDLKSNRERVIDNSLLFQPDNLEQAKNILKRIVENNEYVKDTTLKINERINNREYSNQFKKIISLLNNN